MNFDEAIKLFSSKKFFGDDFGGFIIQPARYKELDKTEGKIGFILYHNDKRAIPMEIMEAAEYAPDGKVVETLADLADRYNLEF